MVNLIKSPLPELKNINFDGKTYNPKHDSKRLKNQLKEVFFIMSDNNWRTLNEISASTGHPPASISARLRDLRKKKFGGFQVNRRRRGHWSEGVYEYQLI